MIKNLKTRYSKLLFFKVKGLWMNLSNEGDLWGEGGKGVEIQSLAGSLLCCSLVGDQFQNRTAWENLAGTSREDLILMVTSSAGPEGARTECKHAGNYHERTHPSEQLSFTPPAHRTTWTWLESEESEDFTFQLHSECNHTQVPHQHCNYVNWELRVNNNINQAKLLTPVV